MSAKWSAFPNALKVLNADILASVQSGLNKQYTRPILFTAVSGEAMTLVSGNSSFGFDAFSQVHLNLQGPQFFEITFGVTSIFLLSASGAVEISSVAGQEIIVQTNGASLTLGTSGTVNLESASGQALTLDDQISTISMDGAGNMQVQCGPSGAIFMTYTPGSPGSWAGSPIDVWGALDRIAAAVAGLLGTPIP
jgi:hypothetical protein